MQRSIFFILFSLLSLLLYAETGMTYDNEALLRELDDVVAHKQDYQHARLWRADSLRHAASAKSGYDRVWELQRAYEQYNRYLTDSVFVVLDEIKGCPEYAQDSCLRIWVALSEARNYGVMGFYATAFDILDDYNPDNYDHGLRLHYYNTIHAVTGWMADFARKSAPDLADEMTQRAAQYHDSIYALEHDSFSRTLIRTNMMYDRGEYQQCIDTLADVMATCDPGAAVYVYARLSQAYEKMGRTEDEIHCLIMTSLSDLRQGVAEYMGLPILAERMHDRGETDRAYNYLICSLEDANICHSSLRALESTTVFPIIENARREVEAQRKWGRLMIYSLIFGVILLFMLGVCIYLYERHRSVVLKIEQEKKHLEKVTFIAEHDELTGLYNRHGGKGPIREALAAHTAGYLCVLDVDLFKQVNDTFGHEIGDMVLKAVADCFSKDLGQINVRLGGDEFCAYCTTSVEPEVFVGRIGKFLDRIRAIRIPEMGDHRVSISLGIAHYDGREDITFDALFRVADSRLYISKQTRGCTFTMHN